MYSVSFIAPQAVIDALAPAGEGKEALEARVERVLEVTCNLGLGLREVVRELRRVVGTSESGR
jgi:hypothetical protein